MGVTAYRFEEAGVVISCENKEALTLIVAVSKEFGIQWNSFVLGKAVKAGCYGLTFLNIR